MPTPSGWKPEGYSNVTPYLVVVGADKVIDFARRVFGAEELERIAGPDGTVGHAAIRIGDSTIMVGEAGGKWTPKPAQLYVYVEDADATYLAAIEAGGTSVTEPQTQFYGDRHGGVTDPAGNLWWIATHVEDVTHEELMTRAAAAGRG